MLTFSSDVSGRVESEVWKSSSRNEEAKKPTGMMGHKGGARAPPKPFTKGKSLTGFYLWLQETESQSQERCSEAGLRQRTCRS